MIRFGWWSTTLAIAEAFGLLVALLLLVASTNRVAGRLLAALMLVAALRLTPYALGFAGVYDAAPWLTFAPFDLTFAAGPLLWLYLRRLATPVLPLRWPWHFTPATLDVAYRIWAFSLPLGAKIGWNDTVHVRWIDPAESGGELLSLALYLIAAIRFRRTYLAWLAQNVADVDDHRLPWIATLLTALGLWLVVAAGFDVVDWFVTPLTYFNRFPEYLAYSALILVLGLEGWRHAGHRFPLMVAPSFPAPPPAGDGPGQPSPAVGAARPPRDWARIGGEWALRIRAEGWWREPGLTLAEVARRLGTNETYLSRALNAGLGTGFNRVINAMRVEAVQAGLQGADPVDVLSLALEAGFSSKASFNRVFHDQTGASPTAWRASHKMQIDRDRPSGTTGPGAAA